MKTIKPITYSYPLIHKERIVILGGGNVTKSILLVSSLLHPTLKFRIIVRSPRSAELLKAFINDLPKIDAEVESIPIIPDLSNELVVLTLGRKTGRFSRRSKKESLFSINRELIENIAPQLKTSTVIVVTNPTTAITKFLIEQGIQAFGVGVTNDQLRFSNQSGAQYLNHYFVGAHNFSELALGTHRVENKANFIFTHEEYKRILQKQDKKTITLASLSKFELDFDWKNLEAVNRSLPKEFQWYARQRIHSKYHSTTTSCALAILNTLSFFLDNQAKGEIVSLEMPLFIPEINKNVVMGWPIDDDSKEPIELTFDNINEDKVAKLVTKYEIQNDNKESVLYFKSPFGECVSISGDLKLIHDFYKKRLAYLYSICRAIEFNRDISAKISIEKTDQNSFNKFKDKLTSLQCSVVPQHRGKNLDEHTDLKIYSNESFRYILFPSDSIYAEVDDSNKLIHIYYDENSVLYHELRRIVRDEISIPCFIANNVRILHAGLMICKDVNVIVVGTQGGGKSTAVLSTLCGDTHSKYGSSERVAVWTENGHLYCLGIPESNTMYAGILKQLPQFVKYCRDTPDSDLWNRSKKVRLQTDDILQSTGCAPIRREVKADIIIEANYDPTCTLATTHTVQKEKLIELLQYNDLTETDNVRLPWLNWFPYSPNNKFYGDTIEPIPVYRIDWATIDGLKENIINIIARYKL